MRGKKNKCVLVRTEFMPFERCCKFVCVKEMEMYSHSSHLLLYSTQCVKIFILKKVTELLRNVLVIEKSNYQRITILCKFSKYLIDKNK